MAFFQFLAVLGKNKRFLAGKAVFSQKSRHRKIFRLICRKLLVIVKTPNVI
jgi:hypothetical protein